MCWHKDNSGRSGFTLAELLVVITIIGIMFLIALPMLSNISGQTKMEAAANSVQSAASMARQFARANNQPTYIIFHNEGTTEDLNLRYRSFAVYTINTHRDPEYVVAGDGIWLTDWELLPLGIYFDINNSDLQNNIFFDRGSWDGGFSGDRRLNIDGDAYTALGFKPRGNQRMNRNHDLYLFEGLYNSTNGITLTAKTGARIRISEGGDSMITPMLYYEDGNGFDPLEQ